MILWLEDEKSKTITRRPSKGGTQKVFVFTSLMQLLPTHNI